MNCYSCCRPHSQGLFFYLYQCVTIAACQSGFLKWTARGNPFFDLSLYFLIFLLLPPPSFVFCTLIISTKSSLLLCRISSGQHFWQARLIRCRLTSGRLNSSTPECALCGMICRITCLTLRVCLPPRASAWRGRGSWPDIFRNRDCAGCAELLLPYREPGDRCCAEWKVSAGKEHGNPV